MRKPIIELAAVGVFSGPMLVALSALTGKAVSWISLVWVFITIGGSVGISMACRSVSRLVRIKRIVALALLGLLVPVLVGVASVSAETGSWGIPAAAAVAFAISAYLLGRLTPLSIDAWTSLETSVSPNKSLERTREG